MTDTLPCSDAARAPAPDNPPQPAPDALSAPPAARRQAAYAFSRPGKGEGKLFAYIRNLQRNGEIAVIQQTGRLTPSAASLCAQVAGHELHRRRMLGRLARRGHLMTDTVFALTSKAASDAEEKRTKAIKALRLDGVLKMDGDK